MSDIDTAFRESRIKFGLKQKPNYLGEVWGSCQTLRCGNHYRVGAYLGGFCKVCSIRHRDDHKLAVKATITQGGRSRDIPNPRIRWIRKNWVKDMSHLMTRTQRNTFYEKPDPEKAPVDDSEDSFTVPKEEKIESVLNRLGAK